MTLRIALAALALLAASAPAALASHGDLLVCVPESELCDLHPSLPLACVPVEPWSRLCSDPVGFVADGPVCVQSWPGSLLCRLSALRPPPAACLVSWPASLPCQLGLPS